MNKEYEFHRPTCPKCGTPASATIGDPSFIIEQCPHCGLIYVARSSKGKVYTYPANEYQIAAFRSHYMVDNSTEEQQSLQK